MRSDPKLWAVVLAALILSCAVSRLERRNVPKPGAVDVNDVQDMALSPFVDYVENHSRTPVEYVVEKFEEHDVVILGEMHEVRENCELIAELIEPLYHRAGVRYFAMEVLKHKNTALANQLVTGEEYDQDLALHLFRDAIWPLWGFKEYMDILRAIWELNRKLPAEAEKFKVVGLSSDIDMYDIMCGSLLSRIDDVVKMLSHDKDMAKVVGKEVLKKKGKVLVQIGYSHSFTHYRQPRVKNDRLVGEIPRFGYVLHEKYGERVFQICLHQWHFGPELATRDKPSLRPVLGGLMEEVMTENGDRAVGFDIVDSPFENLRDRESYYFAYQNYVVFSDLARGYLFLKPLKELKKISWVKGFINESNFEEARGIALKRGWIEKDKGNTPEELDESLKNLVEKP